VGNKMVQFSFKRDKDGNLSETGEYEKELLTRTSFKFPEQGRFSFGVAKVRKVDSDAPEGVRMKEINYTGKNIVTIDVYEGHVKSELNRVKNLVGDKNSPWVVNNRPKDEVWKNDPVSKLPGAGEKKGQVLVAAGISTVQQMKAVATEDLPRLKESTPGISVACLRKWRDCPAHDGTCPHQIEDYRKAENPYLARYGEAQWREKINNSVFMSKYMCVKELVRDIHDRTKEAFKGTTHEDDWYFYHDALSQMTAKTTVEWMKQEGYYKRWLIPQLGLNDDISSFGGRPVGNRPEFMPLDNSLNNDIQLCLSLHCAITAHLPDDDPRKFSMATPNTIVKGILRIYGTEGNVPCSSRIVTDCDKALTAFGKVYEAGGKMVRELCSRSGHRNHAAGRNTDGWGGLRVKNLLREELKRWLHRDAVAVKEERTAFFFQNLKCRENDDASVSVHSSSEGESDDDVE